MKRLISHTKSVFTSDLLLPVLLLLFYITFFFIAHGTIPKGEELVMLFREVYNQYGYQIIFFAAILESLILVGFLVPGSLALAMGAIFARSGELDLPVVVLTASSGAILGYLVDYFLGMAGLDAIFKKLSLTSTLAEIKNRMNKKTLALSFINPTLGSFFSVSAGIVKIPFLTFFGIAVIATLVWFSIWGIIFYLTGDIVLEIVSRYFILVFVIIIGSTFLAQFLKKGK